MRASTEFATVAPRLLTDRPADTWPEDGLHFFVFRLRTASAAESTPDAEGEAPVAVFVMHPASPAPFSAVTVTPSPDGTEPEIHDLRTTELSAVNG